MKNVVPLVFTLMPVRSSGESLQVVRCPRTKAGRAGVEKTDSRDSSFDYDILQACRVSKVDGLALVLIAQYVNY